MYTLNNKYNRLTLATIKRNSMNYLEKQQYLLDCIYTEYEDQELFESDWQDFFGNQTGEKE